MLQDEDHKIGRLDHIKQNVVLLSGIEVENETPIKNLSPRDTMSPSFALCWINYTSK